MRRLRQYTRDYFSGRVNGAEIFAAIYLDPANLFPLANSGQARNRQRLSKQTFVEMVLVDWNNIDLGQVS